MDVQIKYVVYRLNSVLNSNSHLALEKVEFRGYCSNSFDNEEEAIQALFDDNRTYEEYVILKQVTLRYENN